MPLYTRSGRDRWESDQSSVFGRLYSDQSENVGLSLSFAISFVLDRNHISVRT